MRGAPAKLFRLVATRGPASDAMDLLSVLEHELGHAAGSDHTATGLMAETLAVGTRTATTLETQPATAASRATVEPGAGDAN